MKRANAVLFSLLMIVASLAGCLGNDDSNDDSNNNSENSQRTYNWLFTHTAANAKSDNGTITLESSQDVFAFTDRPDRLSGYFHIENFTMLWGPDSTFAEDPPNAVLTWTSENGSMDYAEIILTGAEINEDGFIEYDYTFETGDTIPSILHDTSLLIDDVKNFSGQTMSRADMKGKDLKGADFSNADLEKTKFNNADLSYSNLSGADLSGADLSGADLVHSNLYGANLTDAYLNSVKLRWTNAVALQGCPASLPTDWQCIGNNLMGPYAHLYNADLSNAKLSNVNLGYSDLSNANLSNANLSNVNLSYSDLSNANLTDADLDAVTWKNTICPDGTNSDDNEGSTCENNLQLNSNIPEWNLSFETQYYTMRAVENRFNSNTWNEEFNLSEISIPEGYAIGSIDVVITAKEIDKVVDSCPALTGEIIENNLTAQWDDPVNYLFRQHHADNCAAINLHLLVYPNFHGLSVTISAVNESQAMQAWTETGWGVGMLSVSIASIDDSFPGGDDDVELNVDVSITMFKAKVSLIE